MNLTPAERLILLKLTQVLEIIDPANARQHDVDAQALELGTSAGIAGMFELIDLDPLPALHIPHRPILTVVRTSD